MGVLSGELAELVELFSAELAELVVGSWWCWRWDQQVHPRHANQGTNNVLGSLRPIIRACVSARTPSGDWRHDANLWLYAFRARAEDKINIKGSPASRHMASAYPV